MYFTGYEIKHNPIKIKSIGEGVIEKFVDGWLAWAADYECNFDDKGEVCGVKFSNIKTNGRANFNEKHALAQIKKHTNVTREKF